MLTSARIREDLQPQEGLQWISALKSIQIQQLVQSGALQLSLFDQHDLAEIQHPSYPGERLIACRNPLLAEERSRKRSELLEATEKQLKKIEEATQRKKKPLRGRKEIGLAVGKILGRYKMGKHFSLFIEDDGFRCERKQANIEREAALDGISEIVERIRCVVRPVHDLALDALERVQLFPDMQVRRDFLSAQHERRLLTGASRMQCRH
jgi:hypothetical protein